MKKLILLTLISFGLAGWVYAEHEDDPMLTKIMIDELEWRDADPDSHLVLDGSVWLGNDLNKVWLKTELEYVPNDSEFEEAQVQLLYGRAVAPYWDLQVGVRQDLEPGPSRTWGVIGMQGLAPYFFEIDAAAFISDEGDLAARLELEYELLLTQRWILSPEAELNLYADDDPQRGTGSGLNDLSAGLRLRYEIRRELAPYIGVHWSKKFGNSADFARDRGEAVSDVQVLVGIRFWF